MLYDLIYNNIQGILIKAFNNFYKPTLGLRYIYMFQDVECLVWLGFQLVIFIVTGLFLACKERADDIKRFFLP